MRIWVNGEETDIEEGLTIEALLSALGIDTGAIAIEVNREIVPRGSHGRRVLKQGDKVEVIRMVGGG
jgi:sulfur carrier protein